jgi:arsenate reductase (thioredoxin)
MNQISKIIFVCEHGAAKSILAASYFNKVANEKGLNIQAIARGTNPDEVLSPKAIQGLAEDGLQATESIPQKLLVEEVKSAQKIITFCELSKEYQQGIEIEEWSGVPPVSESYEIARDAILQKLNSLLKQLIITH